MNGLRTLAWRRLGFAVVRVQGQSMAPTLRDGDRVFVRRRPRYGRGDVVVFRAPALDPAAGPPLRIKRVAAAAGDPVPAWMGAAAGGHANVPAGRLAVIGDGRRTGHSGTFGYVAEEHVIGRAVLGRR